MTAWPIWVNGRPDDKVPATDRGLAYGDGLFETLRVEQGRAIFLDAHLARLAEGARRLDIPWRPSGLIEDLQRFLAVLPAQAVAKVILTRGSGGRGYLPPADAEPSCIFSAHPLPQYPDSFARDGIAADVSAIRLSSQPLLAGIKHLNRLEQVLLRREQALLSADEMLVCDTQGCVVEGVASNVFLVRQGNVHTPVLEACGIRGVMREALMREAARRGIPVHEGRYTTDDFLTADEVFFCNSVNGIWPVRRLPGRQWQPGPLTRQLQSFWQESLLCQECLDS